MQITSVSDLPKVYGGYIVQLAWERLSKLVAETRGGIARHLTDEAELLKRVGLYCRLIKADLTGIRREFQRAEIARKTRSEVMYLNLCMAYSAYGGPEEGGWYYTHYMPPVVSVPVLETLPLARLDKLKEYLLKKHVTGDYYHEYRGHGVGGCGDDAGMCRGEHAGDEGYTFYYSYGVPFEGTKERPYYC